MASDTKEMLIVGNNIRNQELLAEFIKKIGYKTIRADSLVSLEQILNGYTLNVGFSLVDITGFNRRIWEFCARLHCLDIPLLVISPKQSADVRKLGFTHGAQTILEKPLIMNELAETIHGFMQAAD